MSSVSTYINSGNVVFEAPGVPRDGLARTLELAIVEDFGFEVRVLLRDLPRVRAVTEGIPEAWSTGADMRCDVLFLWAEVDRAEVVDQLDFNPDIEDVFYVDGAVVWRVDRVNATRSKLTRIVGTDFYKRLTIRNVNTVRKIQGMMEALVLG
jgi:uncharacterized protein (DUF1697 family)